MLLWVSVFGLQESQKPSFRSGYVTRLVGPGSNPGFPIPSDEMSLDARKPVFGVSDQV